jgi:hypothetical protein
MYRIINTADGMEIGSTEAPRYIKKSKSGQNIETTREEATGVAYKSTPYNLLNTEGVGADETVILSEYDAGDNAAETIKNTASIAELETAVCDLDEQINGGN